MRARFTSFCYLAWLNVKCLLTLQKTLTRFVQTVYPRRSPEHLTFFPAPLFRVTSQRIKTYSTPELKLPDEKNRVISALFVYNILERSRDFFTVSSIRNFIQKIQHFLQLNRSLIKTSFSIYRIIKLTIFREKKITKTKLFISFHFIFLRILYFFQFPLLTFS